ncbi:tail fiber assembly protein [Scandinavium tedordense]|uniref:tail fiber assembly protein n=1 Tax=Scandinavium tedordense TaxID=2926521 RepID=UPI0035B0B5B4
MVVILSHKAFLRFTGVRLCSGGCARGARDGGCVGTGTIGGATAYPLKTFGIATEEGTAALAEWKEYRGLLIRVDTVDPEWPTPPGHQAS